MLVQCLKEGVTLPPHIGSNSNWWNVLDYLERYARTNTLLFLSFLLLLVCPKSISGHFTLKTHFTIDIYLFSYFYVTFWILSATMYLPVQLSPVWITVKTVEDPSRA